MNNVTLQIAVVVLLLIGMAAVVWYLSQPACEWMFEVENVRACVTVDQ